MKHYLGVCLALGWLAAAPVAGQVQDAAKGVLAQVLDGSQNVAINLHWENDSRGFRLVDDSDRYYTNGAGFSIAWQPEFADTIAAHLPFADQFGTPDRTAFGIHVGQHIYTPQDTLIAARQPNDRPWAGYLYGGAFVERIAGNTMDQFRFDIGIVGPSSLAEEAQDGVHELIGDDPPAGWDNQLRDELVFNAYLKKKWRFDLASFNVGEVPLDLQVIPKVGGALGTVFRRAEGGAMLRLGYGLPDDFGPSRLNEPTGPPGARRDGLSIYGFVDVTGRVVEHNIFLDGNNYRSSSSVDKNNLVGELWAGISLAWRWKQFDLELTYSQTVQTEEFENQDGIHVFGAWTMSWICWF